METTEQQENLPITEGQIQEFLGWVKKFSGKGKTVELGPGKSETTFTSYEKDGKKCINAKNTLMNATWTYNPRNKTISVFHDDRNSFARTLAEDGELNKEKLKHDLRWFQDCVPPLNERISKSIKNLFTEK